MNGSPHGPLPITGDLPGEQRWRAASNAVSIAARRGASAGEALDFLEALGLQDQIPALRAAESRSPARTPTRTRANAPTALTRQISASTDPTRTTSTTEETA